METLAPPVVAVVVTHDPGAWFEETLASIASQDYRELSVLVLDTGASPDLAARVAAVLPSAYVRHFEENRGFGATVNEVLSMVDGAAYFLVCHDDVALFPDAVHLLVEEAFRSNAGVVSPKVVSWDDPELLIHVGMSVDKGGSVVDRVQPHEIDHGQHDAVRDVFVAPGGCTLMRADLFDELGGFDPTIVAMGEDLDICWRAQVVGARILVAPDARVRHLEVLASGERSLDPSLFAAADSGPGGGGSDGGEDEPVVDASSDATAVAPPAVRPPRHPVTLQELQRRHELLAVLKCYSKTHLVRVLPQVFVLAVAEIVVAELAGNRTRARAVVRAWRWNFGRLGVIRTQRAELQAKRRVGDKEIRLLQVRGSARLTAYMRRVFQFGFHGAHADELAAAEAIGPTVPVEEAAEAEAGAEQTEAGRVSGQARLAVWLTATLIVVIGSRGVLTGRLPAVGQFTPFPSWSATLSQFFTGWHPSGVGTTAPAAPALGIAGVLGTVLIGSMGLTQKVLVFGCLPVGVWGAVRLLRPFGSQRASLVSGLAYLAMALPYDALALGRWGALVVYAGAPWVLASLVRSTGLEPFVRRVEVPLPPTGAGAGPPAPGGAWASRHGLLGGALALGVLEAVLISFVPAAALVVLLVALAVVASSMLFRDAASTGRAVRLALGSTGVALVICLPWFVGVLSSGKGVLAVFGVPTPTSGAASWGSLLRFAVGPIGGSPLAWGFVVAAAAPLVLARGVRFRWAVRFWTIALAFWMAAWVIGRGWTGGLAVDPLVLLGPAAAATAASIGLGVAAFERDLRKAEFGWRQLTTAVGILAVALASVPTLVSALPGRWELPVNDFSQALDWMHADTATGAFRVLWLGDPRSLDLGGWGAGDGLAYATSENGLPDARWLWNATSPGPAAALGSDVDLARADRTDRLGSLIAPAGVRYVVVLTSVAPEIPGEQTPTVYPVPSDLLPALGRQLDLSQVLSGTGITVFANADWIPQRAEVPGAPGAAVPLVSVLAAAPGVPILPGAVPVLPGPAAARSFRGPLATGTVFAAVAPAGKWVLVGDSGAVARRSSSFGWAARYRVLSTTTGTLRFEDGLLPLVMGVFSILVWALALVALVDRRRIRREWERVGRPRSWSTRRSSHPAETLEDAWSTDEGMSR
ncbi:MAG: glycosyltransferase family 2 protein [Acidimicrobiales bacterium]|jgi:GT2 family glycosyltransferase